MFDSGNVTLPKHNALYLWDVPTPETLDLYLACPKSCGKYYVEHYFFKPIPHPILGITPSLEIEDIIEDIDLPKIDFGQIPEQMHKVDEEQLAELNENTWEDKNDENLWEQN